MVHDEDFDSSLKDKLLETLLERMEEVIGQGVSKRKGLAVEVAAPDKEHLKEGLEQAKDVVDNVPSESSEASSEEPAAPSEESDEDRLAALLSEDDEDQK